MLVGRTVGNVEGSAVENEEESAVGRMVGSVAGSVAGRMVESGEESVVGKRAESAAGKMVGKMVESKGWKLRNQLPPQGALRPLRSPSEM
jgi:outer membrane lipoprotein SlyB